MFTLLTAALAFTGSAAAQNSSYWPTKALYEGLGIFNEGLAAVGGASSWIDDWPHNTSIGIPAICYYEATEPWPNTGNSTHAATPRCRPENVWVWDITYSDCPNSPLTFCFCGNAPLIPEEIVDNFALLPVGLRQEISAVIVMPEEPHLSGNAYARGNSITYRVNRHDSGTINPTTALHEAAHVLDYNTPNYSVGSVYNHYGFSDSYAFRSALRNDTCYADPYAMNSSGFQESWAQDLVLRWVQVEEVDPVSHWCIFNQMHVLAAQTDELLSIETCNERKQTWEGIIPIDYKKGSRRRSAEDAMLEKIAKLPVTKKTPLW